MEVILLPRPGYTALSRPLWAEAEALRRSVKEISGRNSFTSSQTDPPLVYSDGIKYSWMDLCLKFNGECVDNNFLSLAQSPVSENQEIQGVEKSLKYPKTYPAFAFTIEGSQGAHLLCFFKMAAGGHLGFQIYIF